MFECYILKINIVSKKHCKKFKIIWEQNWCNDMHTGWEEVWLTARKKFFGRGKGTQRI